jgi:hypothetical protein
MATFKKRMCYLDVSADVDLGDGDESETSDETREGAWDGFDFSVKAFGSCKA